jgi:hypothetical protein
LAAACLGLISMGASNPVVLILASAADQDAWSTANAWSKRADVRVLVPQDLSCPGWSYRIGAPKAGTLVVSGDVLPVAALSGVYTRLDAVRESDLPHVGSPDRGYVASEMHAFLTAWLTTLPCPVVNAPSTTNLNGPGWTWERWVLAASRAYLRVVPTRRTNAQSSLEPLPLGASLVHIIGQRCVGAPPELTDRLVRFAHTVGVDVMSVLLSPSDRVNEPVLLDFSVWLNLSDPEIVEATFDVILAKALR